MLSTPHPQFPFFSLCTFIYHSPHLRRYSRSAVWPLCYCLAVRLAKRAFRGDFLKANRFCGSAYMRKVASPTLATPNEEGQSVWHAGEKDVSEKGTPSRESNFRQHVPQNNRPLIFKAEKCFSICWGKTRYWISSWNEGASQSDSYFHGRWETEQAGKHGNFKKWLFFLLPLIRTDSWHRANKPHSLNKFPTDKPTYPA